MHNDRPETVDDLARRIVALESGNPQRFLVGLAGPPAAGKTTLAARLSSALNSARSGSAVAVSMDGFHFSNAQLEERGDHKRKGQPDTFDIAGFLARLHAVRETDIGVTVRWPVYDRSIHEPVSDGVTICSESVIVVEGNYLLLDHPGWREVRSYLDTVWYLDVGFLEIERRLVKRHVTGGSSPEDARRKVTESDLANADLVARTACRADLVIFETGGQYRVVES